MPPLDLGEGVLVRGYIDRVDLAPGGEAVVYDYKSGSPAPPDRWLGERNFQIGLYMRAVEQLLGARVAGGFYQPLSGRDLRARGVLAAEEGVTLECVRGDARPAAEVRELVEEIVAVARTAAAEARAGQLEARPATCGFGGRGCKYPSICRCDLEGRDPRSPDLHGRAGAGGGAPPRSAAARGGGRQRQDLGAGRALRAGGARGRHRPGADPGDHLHRARRRGAARAGARAPAGAGRARGRARHRGRSDRDLPRLLRTTAARPRSHRGTRPRVRDPRRGRRRAAARARLSPRARHAPGREAPPGRRRPARRLRRRPRAADGAGRVRRAA